VIVPPDKETGPSAAAEPTAGRWAAKAQQQAAAERRRGLRRLATALGQLRSEAAVITAQSNLLASLEAERALTPEERAEARRLKAESRRLYWELRALIGEYNALRDDTHPSR